MASLEAKTYSSKLIIRLRIILLSMLVLVLIFCVLGVYSEHLHRHYMDAERRVLNFIGDIKHFDEVLTMSAHMASATGDLQWERRYRDFEPQLDDAIKEAIALSPTESMAKAANKTNLANLRLVAIENKVFDLVRQGDGEKAVGLLNSREYTEQKGIYNDGMSELTVILQNNIRNMTTKSYRMFLGTVIILAAFGSLLLFAWGTVRQMRKRLAEKEQAEKVLKESEERYRKLFQGAAEGILVADTETKEFKYVNPAICKMLGYTEEELRRLGVRDIHPKADLEHAFSEFEAQARGEKILTPDIPCLRKDGTIMYADIKTAMVLIDGRQCNIGFFTDITQHKLAEQKLAYSEEIYRKTIENAKGVPYQRQFDDKDDKYVFVGPGIEEMFGIPREEFTPGRFTELAEAVVCLTPNVPATLKAADVALNRGDRDTYKRKMKVYHKEISRGQSRRAIRGDIRIRTPQGQVKWITDSSFYIRDEKTGELLGSMGILQDITERRRIETELEKYKERIFQVQKHAYVSSVGTIIAHQINQPLTKINILLDRALDNAEDGSCCPSVIKDVKESLAEVKEASSIIRKFRQYSQDSALEGAGKINVSVVADRIVSVLSERAAQAKMHISIKDLEDLPEVETNEMALEQIFLIIIQNAIEAADGQKPYKLDITGKSAEGNIELQFADDCCGIAPENLDRIFEPFFSIKTEDKGMGLGLDIVQQILISYGGEIRVESRLGKGTTFSVTLPISNALKP